MMTSINTSLEKKRSEMIAIREKYERNISQMTPEQKERYAEALNGLKVKLEKSLSDYATSFIKESVFLNEDVTMAFVSLYGKEFGHNASQYCIRQDWDGLDKFLNNMREALIKLSFSFLSNEYARQAVVTM